MFISLCYIFGVEFVGLIYFGLIGCLFFKEMLKEWNICEKEFYDIELDCVLGLVNLFYVEIVYMGKLKGEEKKFVVVEGVCIVLLCEYGGNCDIKDLLCGFKVYFLVYVKDGGLFVGDLYFSQGDGEIIFCGVIEMVGWIYMCVNLIKDGMVKYVIKNLIFKFSLIILKYDDYFIFEGILVDE